MRGRKKPWAQDFIAAHEELKFNKDEKFDKPLTLEVGIGKGDFIVNNAKANKDYIHIGVELNESIYAIAMKKIVNENIDNIRMLNTKALDLPLLINENSISKLYLNFSDPWPQNGYRKRRLVHPLHLEVFEKLLVDGGEIIFKTDNFNLFEMEKQVDAICDEAYKYRMSAPAKSEQVLRDGLQRFPGNDIILNNLLYTLDYHTRSDEVITLCKTLIESTKDDSVKYDACRILATCYKENGQHDLVKPTLELIPEIYFSKLELMASLLDGEDSYEAAQKQKNLSAEDLIDMLIITGKRLKENGEIEKANSQFKIAKKVIAAFEDDFLETKWFSFTIFESVKNQRNHINELLKE